MFYYLLDNGTTTGAFYVDVVNGSKNTGDTECAENTTGVSTRIMLVCNSTVEWKTRDLTDIIQVEYSEPCRVSIISGF